MKRERDAATAAADDRAVVKHAVFEHPRPGLLDLPLKLLDEIARYLERGDAVNCLRVCSTLHGAFARRVWQSIEEHLPHHRLDITAVALDRYGHLVRYIYISYRRATKIPFKSIPNVTRLELPSDCLESVLGNEDIQELVRLQRIDIVGNVESLKVEYAELVNGFSSRASMHGQSVAFKWTWSISNQKERHLLSQMVAKLANVSQHSFDLTMRCYDPVSQAEIAALSSLISNLHLRYINPRGSIVIRENTIFPRLIHLQLENLITREHSSYIFTEFTPTHLPALQHLTLECTIRCKSIVEPVLDHTWSTVTKFDLFSCGDGAFFGRFIQQLPNVTELRIIRCGFPVDIHAIATHMPCLQTLQIVINRKESIPRLANRVMFANLIVFGLIYELRGKSVLISPEWLSLMLDSAPNLGTVQIKGHHPPKADLGSFAGHTNQSVQSVILLHQSGSKKVDVLADIETWMAFFPNTKMLSAQCYDTVDLAVVKQQYPNTVFIIESL
ncbi:hypothetical protein GQ42DRAFT_60075 [Ramicandelaber brevisporus]|nr:hypothetical protein GQ42DRAFT_60075 [Ramicandelaber brevisporus]